MTPLNTTIGPDYNVPDLIDQLELENQDGSQADTLKQLHELYEHNEGTGLTYQGLTAQQWHDKLAQFAQQWQEELTAINAKQHRDRAEHTVEFRVASDPTVTSFLKHREGISDYDTAKKIAHLYDNSNIETRTTTPWKPVTTHTAETIDDTSR